MKREDIEFFLKNLMSSWQVAKIYELNHPKFVEVVGQLHESLKSILDKKGELIIGIVDQELASGENIFFDLSKKMTAAINNLKEHGIERMVFQKGITPAELTKFLAFLITPLDGLKGEAQDNLSLRGVKNIIVGKIKAPGTASAAQAEEEEQVQGELADYEKCLDRVSLSLNSLIDEEAVDYLNLQLVASNIMENLMGSYQAFFRLSRTKSHDAITFIHLLNVSILSIYFSSKLGFCRDDCLAVGMAALFHDIGKLYITRKIIQKPGGLDKEEFLKIKSHTILGAEILLRYVDTLTALPVVVAFEHHLGYDLGGYPKGEFAHKPHIASSIVSICDVYDALMQRRSYKKGFSPEVVYDIMIRDRGKKFPSELFDKFFKITGVWPKGTIVLLEDNRVGIVRQINEDAIFRPQIEIVSEGKREIVNLKEVDESIKIKRSLNPLDEGEKYLELV